MYECPLIVHIHILYSSRSAIAQEVGKDGFNLTESEKIVASSNSNSATSDDVQVGIDHSEKILKYHRSNGNNEELIRKAELKKIKLLEKYILLRTNNQPSDNNKLLARQFVRKGLSTLKNDEREVMENVREFNVAMVNAVCGLEKSINAIGGDSQESQELIALRQTHVGLVSIVHQATKANIGTDSSAQPFLLADLMQQWYLHIDLIEACVALMNMNKFSHIPTLAVLQKKLTLLEEALTSVKSNKLMCQSKFLDRWNALEDEESTIVSSATCEEGLYVNEKGSVVSADTKDAIELIPLNGKFGLNRMTGVKQGQRSLIEMHWHPNLPNGWLEELLKMLEEGVPPNLESDLKNGCITAYRNLVTSVVHSEAGGQVTSALIEMVKERIFFNDYFDVFAHSKTRPLMQFEKCAEMSNMTKTQFILRSKIRLMAQI